MKTNLGKNKGITLIALVITIIILLILAGVSIAMLTGNNGILSQASKAKNETELASAREQLGLILTDLKMGAYENGEEPKITEDNKNDILDYISGQDNVESVTGTDDGISVTIDGEYSYLINKDGTIGEVVKREGIKVGDYVNYTYDTVEEGYPLEQAKSGYTSDQTIAQTIGLKWRIMNIDASGRVDIISETPTSQRVYFQGARGYNNGVYVINDICRSLYSNNSLEITARSLDLKDIEDKMNATGKAARDAYKNSSSGTQYGHTKPYGSGYNKYPNLYAQENGSGINTEEVKKNGIDVNADGYDIPTTEDSSTADGGLTVTQTYYYFSNTPSSYFDDQEFYKLVFGTNPSYWLASRYASCYSDHARFGLRVVLSSSLNGDNMFYSDGDTNISNYRLRPVVSLGSDIQITPVENADGSSTTNMHQISKK